MYCQVPDEIRKEGNEELEGGYIILEMFSDGHKHSGSYFGPKCDDLLVSVQELKNEFKDLNILYLEEKKIELDEGYHQGKGVIT
ncbi:MAG: hypothetical protein AAGI25_15390 [Bacteroidota bacterium]